MRSEDEIAPRSTEVLLSKCGGVSQLVWAGVNIIITLWSWRKVSSIPFQLNSVTSEMFLSRTASFLYCDFQIYCEKLTFLSGQVTWSFFARVCSWSDCFHLFPLVCIDVVCISLCAVPVPLVLCVSEIVATAFLLSYNALYFFCLTHGLLFWTFSFIMWFLWSWSAACCRLHLNLFSSCSLSIVTISSIQ